jgi:hypothetical protein
MLQDRLNEFLTSYPRQNFLTNTMPTAGEQKQRKKIKRSEF